MQQKALSLPQIFSKQKPNVRTIQSIKSQATFSKKNKKIAAFWLYATYVLIALTSVLMLSYLLGVNAQASIGYEIQKIQQRVEKLTDENKQLNLRVSEQTSIAQIQFDYLNNGYAVIKQPQYLVVNSYTQR